MKTLQEYLMSQSVIDHALRVTVHASGAMTLTIHPQGADGDTVDYVLLNGNLLLPQQNARGELLSPERVVDNFLDAQGAQ